MRKIAEFQLSTVFFFVSLIYFYGIQLILDNYSIWITDTFKLK